MWRKKRAPVTPTEWQQRQLDALAEAAYRRGYVDGYLVGWNVAIDADIPTMRRHLAALEAWRGGDCTQRAEPPEPEYPD